MACAAAAPVRAMPITASFTRDVNLFLILQFESGWRQGSREPERAGRVFSCAAGASVKPVGPEGHRSHESGGTDPSARSRPRGDFLQWPRSREESGQENDCELHLSPAYPAFLASE